jgi:hypothetical protein
MDDPNAQVRDIIERTIDELVALGMKDDHAAVRLLVFQCLIRLEAADDFEFLERLRDEIDDALADGEEEPPARPVLRVVN